MAASRTHAGYRQLHVYLKSEGWRINHKRLYRLYTEEGLGLRRKRPRRRRSAATPRDHGRRGPRLNRAGSAAALYRPPT